MKIIKFVSVLLVMVVSLLSVSCTTNVEPIDPAVLNPIIDPNAPVQGAFKVDFGDQTYSSTTATAVITGTTITIAALKSSTGENFTINLKGITTGEYSTTDKVSIIYKEEVADVFGYLSQNTLGSTATVNVTSINNTTKRIKGTFKFIGNWNDPTNATPPAAIQFTNGTFDLPFTTDVPNPTSTFFKADFNGQTFNATTTAAIITNGTILINGVKDSNGENFALILNGSTTGVYNTQDDLFTYSTSSMAEYGYTNFTNIPSESTGSVTITSINETNHTISGTFSYIGHWSDFTAPNPPAPIGFTNGSFTVPYTVSIPSTTDTFFAKVDGLEFVESFIATGFATVGTEDVISVNATNSADDRISISINDTYTVGNSYSAVAEAKCTLLEGGVVSNASIGTVTIVTKTDTRISGTFSFTTVSGRTITEGAFDVAY
jgi:hypothetical protein